MTPHFSFSLIALRRTQSTNSLVLSPSKPIISVTRLYFTNFPALPNFGDRNFDLEHKSGIHECTTEAEDIAIVPQLDGEGRQPRPGPGISLDQQHIERVNPFVRRDALGRPYVRHALPSDASSDQEESRTDSTSNKQQSQFGLAKYKVSEQGVSPQPIDPKRSRGKLRSEYAMRNSSSPADDEAQNLSPEFPTSDRKVSTTLHAPACAACEGRDFGPPSLREHVHLRHIGKIPTPKPSASPLDGAIHLRHAEPLAPHSLDPPHLYQEVHLRHRDLQVPRSPDLGPKRLDPTSTSLPSLTTASNTAITSPDSPSDPKAYPPNTESAAPLISPSTPRPEREVRLKQVGSGWVPKASASPPDPGVYSGHMNNIPVPKPTTSPLEGVHLRHVDRPVPTSPSDTRLDQETQMQRKKPPGLPSPDSARLDLDVHLRHADRPVGTSTSHSRLDQEVRLQHKDLPAMSPSTVHSNDDVHLQHRDSPMPDNPQPSHPDPEASLRQRDSPVSINPALSNVETIHLRHASSPPTTSSVESQLAQKANLRHADRSAPITPVPSRINAARLRRVSNSPISMQGQAIDEPVREQSNKTVPPSPGQSWKAQNEAAAKLRHVGELASKKRESPQLPEPKKLRHVSTSPRGRYESPGVEREAPLQRVCKSIELFERRSQANLAQTVAQDGHVPRAPGEGNIHATNDESPKAKQVKTERPISDSEKATTSVIQPVNALNIEEATLPRPNKSSEKGPDETASSETLRNGQSPNSGTEARTRSVPVLTGIFIAVPKFSPPDGQDDLNQSKLPSPTTKQSPRFHPTRLSEQVVEPFNGASTEEIVDQALRGRTRAKSPPVSRTPPFETPEGASESPSPKSQTPPVDPKPSDPDNQIQSWDSDQGHSIENGASPSTALALAPPTTISAETPALGDSSDERLVAHASRPRLTRESSQESDSMESAYVLSLVHPDGLGSSLSAIRSSGVRSRSLSLDSNPIRTTTGAFVRRTHRFVKGEVYSMPEMLDLIDNTAVDMGLDLCCDGQTGRTSRTASPDDLSCWDGAADSGQKGCTRESAGRGFGDALHSSQSQVWDTGANGEKAKLDASSGPIMHSSGSPGPWPEEVRPRISSSNTAVGPVSSNRDVHDGKGGGEKAMKR
ncbi:MAG: hypothetical protein Q9165_006386 [Trypethelium subeluteriae]